VLENKLLQLEKVTLMRIG